jgi:serine O-acetyltransferase
MSDNVWNEIRSDYDAYYDQGFSWLPDPSKSEFKRRWERLDSIVLRGAWPAVVCFRIKKWAWRKGIPFVPFICDTVNRIFWGVLIADHVRIDRGLCLAHGYVVIDGGTSIGKNCSINPYVTIGLTNSSKVGFSLRGPALGDNVYIGTGAKILGPVTIGDNVKIGANAVVITDIPDNHTAVGAPARAIPQKPLPARKRRTKGGA